MIRALASALFVTVIAAPLAALAEPGTRKSSNWRRAYGVTLRGLVAEAHGRRSATTVGAHANGLALDMGKATFMLYGVGKGIAAGVSPMVAVPVAPLVAHAARRPAAVIGWRNGDVNQPRPWAGLARGITKSGVALEVSCHAALVGASNVIQRIRGRQTSNVGDASVAASRSQTRRVQKKVKVALAEAREKLARFQSMQPAPGRGPRSKALDDIIGTTKKQIGRLERNEASLTSFLKSLE